MTRVNNFIREFTPETALEGDLYLFHGGKLLFAARAADGHRKMSFFKRWISFPFYKLVYNNGYRQALGDIRQEIERISQKWDIGSIRSLSYILACDDIIDITDELDQYKR